METEKIHDFICDFCNKPHLNNRDYVDQIGPEYYCYKCRNLAYVKTKQEEQKAFNINNPDHLQKIRQCRFCKAVVDRGHCPCRAGTYSIVDSYWIQKDITTIVEDLINNA